MDMLRLEHTGGLELDSTLDCGQCFRWSRTPAGWAGVVDGRSVLARMEGDTLLLEGPDETERDFWSRYFALDVDYPALLARYQAGNRRLAACVAENPGIRVLRQPFFETLCTFILSQNNNIPRIRGLVERLCALCGSPLENGQHAFPTPEQLAACTEEQLATLRAGWRAGYLADATQKVLGHLPGPEALTALPLADAQAALMTIHGVGPKVADCTLLYGLGRAWIEGLRTDSLYLFSTGIRVSQLVAAVSFLAAAGILTWVLVKKNPARDTLYVNRRPAEPQEDEKQAD